MDNSELAGSQAYKKESKPNCKDRSGDVRYRSARDPEKHVSQEVEKEGEVNQLRREVEDSNMREHETTKKGNLIWLCALSIDPFRRRTVEHTNKDGQSVHLRHCL